MSPDEYPRGQPNPPQYPEQSPDLFQGGFGAPREQYPRQDGQYRGQDEPYRGQDEQYPAQDEYGALPYDDYDPYQSDPPNSGRGRMVALFVGLSVIGLLIGIGAAKLLGGKDGTLPLTQPPTATAAAAQPTDKPTKNSDHKPTPTPSATKAANYRSIPQDPTSEKGLDFGFMTKVGDKDGTVTLRFDRATFYSGAAATKHNKGVPPDDDYLIVNTNKALRSFEVDPQASIVASTRLANEPGGQSGEALTLSEFVTNAQTALDDSKVPIWVRHTNGLTGPITALAEQYLP
jgi:hypothetical protein